MRVAPSVQLSPQQREILEQHSRARSLPARVVERARIVLLAAEGKQDKEIAAQLASASRRPPAGENVSSNSASKALRRMRRGLVARRRSASKPSRAWCA